MPEFRSSAGPLPPIPTDISLVQFILDSHRTSTVRTQLGVPLLVDDPTGRSLDLEEIRSRTDALANGLKRRYNLRVDDVVLIFSKNNIDYPLIIWAVHRLGGIISGANPDFSADELHYQLALSKACLVFVHPDALSVALDAAKVCGLPAERLVILNGEGAHSDLHKSLGSTNYIDDLVDVGHGPRDFIEPKIDAKTKLAFLSFSSGTTGRPKAVAIPHISPITNIIQMAVQNKVEDQTRPDKHKRYKAGDVAICVLPLYHIYGLVLNLHFSLFCGMSVVIVPKFNFVQMLKSIVKYRITHLMIVPPQAVLLCKHPAVKEFADRLQVVRCIMVGAAPLSREVNQRLFQLLPDAEIGQSYGMTETCTALSSWPVTHRRGASGSGGQLLPGVIARVVKEDGSLADYDEPGELVVKTPSVALRYENDAQATHETFVDGWVRTGDKAKIDRNAEVWILDRMKEIMKVRGFQVAPSELEGCVLDHPDVSDACVVGVPDEYSGELPFAFVVLKDEVSQSIRGKPQEVMQVKESIAKHVSRNKVAYKHLKGGVEIVSIIPKNPSGKLLRRVLRDQARIMKSVVAKL